MRDARELGAIPPLWAGQAKPWRDTPFVWKRWTRPHDEWDHDHCRFCNAYITDYRDRDPYDKHGPVDGGLYRWAYYADDGDGRYIWVCRTCFKRVAPEFGWTRVRRHLRASRV